MFFVQRDFRLFLIFTFIPFFSWAQENIQENDPAQQWALDWVKRVEINTGPLLFSKEMASVYSDFSFLPIWHDYQAKEELETQINVISLSGISQDFAWRAKMLRELRAMGAWQAYDVFATDTFLALISYIDQISKKGKSWFFGGMHTQKPLPPAPFHIEALKTAVEEQNLYTFVLSLRPQTPQYLKMLNALIAFQDKDALYLPFEPQENVIRVGDALENRNDLISNLISHGFLTPLSGAQLKMEDRLFYDPALELQVKKFQLKHGLNDDGVIGNKTQRWLKKSVDDRIQILALNMERLRLWPTGRSNIILVNIPSFNMQMWMNSKLLFDSKVVVGRPSRRTPLFESTLGTVVINPKWNVPEKIMREDILPKMIKDRDYLKEHAYTVLNQWWAGEAISDDEIDWESLIPSEFPYRLQQSPGIFNALGRYKFNTPNRNAIYLHDTPNKGLFNRPQRAFSSGCIRVSNAQLLAETLFALSGLKMKELEPDNQTLKTKNVALTKPFDFVTIYQTAWIDGEGEVHFRDDIYQYDLKYKDLISSAGSLAAHNFPQKTEQRMN